MTALVIITVNVPFVMENGETVMLGAWASGETGAALSSLAFSGGISGGQWIVNYSLAIFAFTTLISWSYYTERAAEYLFGVKVIPLVRLLWIVVIPIGAMMQLEVVWSIGSSLNALMAVPNLIAIILLSGGIFAVTKAALSKGEDENAP